MEIFKLPRLLSMELIMDDALLRVLESQFCRRIQTQRDRRDRVTTFPIHTQNDDESRAMLAAS